MGSNGETTARDHPHRQWVFQEDETRSLGDLIGELTRDMSTLMRKEIELARVEMTEKLTSTRQNITLMVAGVLILHLSAIALVIAVIWGLGTLMPLWLSALLVGLLLAIGGAIAFMNGRNGLSEINVVPEKTLASIKEDAEMVKEKIS